MDYALPGIFVGLLGVFSTSRARLRAGLVALSVGAILALLGLAIVAILVVPVLVAVFFSRIQEQTETGGRPA